MKKIIRKETLLLYPDFNKPFNIHTHASHTQQGAVISKNNKPVAFYSFKLKPEQTWYTTTKRKLLSIVETRTQGVPQHPPGTTNSCPYGPQ
jgi:hypothetical protein